MVEPRGWLSQGDYVGIA